MARDFRKIQLSQYHSETESFNNITIKDKHTSGGIFALTARSYSPQTYAIAEKNIGANSLSRIEIINGLNINNLSDQSLRYLTSDTINKYNPKIYLGSLASVATNWNYNSDNSSHPSSGWPESLAKNTTLQYVYHKL